MALAKLLLTASTTALGLGLAALAPQDEARDDAKPKVETATVTVKAQNDEPADALGDLYDRLLKLRAERLTDRPKGLADDAAKLYRQALKAAEEKDDAKAKALTDAARELTRALELSLKTRREVADPDLPPPPGRTARRVYYYKRDAAAGALPPALGEEGEVEKGVMTTDRGDTFTVRVGADPKDATATGNVRVRMLRKDGEEPKRDVIVRKLDGAAAELRERVIGRKLDGPGRERPEGFRLRLDETKDRPEGVQVRVEAARATAEAARADAVQARAKMLKELKLHDLDLSRKAEGGKVELELPKTARIALDDLKSAEARARLHETLAGIHTAGAQVRGQLVLEKTQGRGADEKESLAALKATYETILKARKDSKKEEDRPYLDAARDLYNAARREAEAKRFDRAAELARAAESLTKADRSLKFRFESRFADGQQSGSVARFYTTKPKEGQVQFRARVVESDADKADKKEEKAETKEVRAETIVIAKPRPDAKPIEKPATAKPEGDKGEAGDKEAVQGIGVMISFEDGRAQVNDLVADGPAARDGRIKAGDAVVGVVDEKGATVGFADKSLQDVTKILRGKVGSKVKVVVQPKGSDDLKVYEIERRKLDLPKAEAGEKEEVKEERTSKKPAAGEGAKLPPMID